MYKVETLNYDELPENWKDCVPDDGCGKDAANYIVIYYDGEIMKVESDAIESEDFNYARDLDWIAFELESAYNLGFRDGKKENQNKP
tara:strand:- start:3500 stop:3760 length:261 start_codon:yes stop_codon:yes gene_type:complete